MTQTTGTDLSKRTPEEVFTHHAQALGAENLDATLRPFVSAPWWTWVPNSQTLSRGKGEDLPNDGLESRGPLSRCSSCNLLTR